MEEFELVLEVLEGGANGVQALGLENRHVIVVDPELLDEDESRPAALAVRVVVPRLLLPVEAKLVGFPGRILDRIEEMSPGDRVDGVAELVVQIPDFLEHGLNLVDLHFPFHLGENED